MYIAVIIIKEQENFLQKKKKSKILKEYQKDLERESQGVSERIKELDAN